MSFLDRQSQARKANLARLESIGFNVPDLPNRKIYLQGQRVDIRLEIDKCFISKHSLQIENSISILESRIENLVLNYTLTPDVLLAIGVCTFMIELKNQSILKGRNLVTSDMIRQLKNCTRHEVKALPNNIIPAWYK